MTSATQASGEPRSFSEALAALRQPKMAMMLVLGFTAGLPFLLYYSTLSVWLELSGVEAALIGFFSWFGLAYSFKFLWAPLVDRVDPPGLARIFGRRRAWIFTAQIGLALAMAGLATSSPAVSLGAAALFSFMIAFTSATQDIAVDAWRIEAAANDDEQATLAAAYQYGYKVGMVVAGGVALVIAGAVNFNAAYMAMACAMALGALVFSVWDRRYGVQAAAGAGALLISVGLASAFGAFGSILTPGSIGAAALRVVELGFYAIAALAATAFVVYLAGALRDRPEGSTFSISALGTGLAFAVAAFAGVAALAAALGFIIPVLAEASGLSPDRRTIAQTAAYVAAAPIVLCAAAIPFIRRLPADAAALKHPTYAPFLDFFWRHGWVALLILVFVSSYRLSDIVMGVMAKTAYSSMGYTPADIGIVSGAYGPWIVFVGVALAGLSALKFGLRASLVIGAVVSIAGNAIFAWLVQQSSDSLLPLFIAVTADNIAGGYAGTIFVAFLSTMVAKSFAGTQYAIFSSIYTLGPKLVAGTSGVIVDAVGYSQFFLFAAALGAPAVVLSLFAHRMAADRASVVAAPGAA